MTMLVAENDVATVPARRSLVETFQYDNATVRNFAVATAAWGLVAFLVGLIVALKLVFPGFIPDIPYLSYRPAAAAAHQRGRVRLWRQRHLPRGLLLAAAAVQGAHVQRSPQRHSLLGLAAHHRDGRLDAAAGLHHQQGIRGTGMADRSADHRRLGGVRLEHDRHDPPAPRAAHVRVDLVLPRDVHHRRPAPRRQLARAARQPPQELLDVCRRAGRAGAVVVRAQRGGVLPDHAVPGGHVLLHPEGGEPAGVLLPAVDRALLVADLPLHLGRSPPSALHGAAGLGADARHGVLRDADRPVVGRHGERPAHLARGLGSRA